MLNQKIKYLIVGLLNACFGYLFGLASYFLLSSHLHIIYIGCFINLITITFSFFTYKFFVFNTSGHWFFEYLRSFVVYGLGAIISIIALWLLLDKLMLNIYISQAISMVLAFVISFFGHKNFTFNSVSVRNDNVA
jgi:putative flippase GtrA